MKAKTNQINATQSTIEIHAKNQEVIIIGTNHYSAILRAIALSLELRKTNSSQIWKLPISDINIGGK